MQYLGRRRRLGKDVFAAGGLFLILLSYTLKGEELAREFGTQFLKPELRPRDAVSDYFKQDQVTGDWWGARDKIRNYGVEIYGAYVSEVMANVQGGLDYGSVYDGSLYLGMGIDLEQLTRGVWPGAFLEVNAGYVHGSSISERYVGDYLSVSNINASEDEWSVDFSFTQYLLELQYAIILGYMGPASQFALNNQTNFFFNSTFGFPSVIAGRPEKGAYSDLAPGMVLRWEPNRAFYLQMGVYGSAPETRLETRTPGTIEFQYHDEAGTLLLAETGYRFNQSSGEAWLPGSYRLGTWFRTRDSEAPETRNLNAVFAFNAAQFGLAPGANVNDFRALVARSLNNDEHLGFYFSLDQTIFQQPDTPDRSLSLFLRGGMNVAGTTLFDYYADGGLSYRGLVPGRRNDVLAVGLAYAGISDLANDYEDGLKAIFPGYSPDQDYEAVLEVTYSIELTPFWSLQPDIQWVLHPGGSNALGDALVLGIRNIIYF
jgi:porin